MTRPKSDLLRTSSLGCLGMDGWRGDGVHLENCGRKDNAHLLKQGKNMKVFLEVGTLNDLESGIWGGV